MKAKELLGMRVWWNDPSRIPEENTSGWYKVEDINTDSPDDEIEEDTIILLCNEISETECTIDELTMGNKPNIKVYTVTMSWNDDGVYDSCVEKAFASKEMAEGYAKRRFWEERNMGKYEYQDDDDLNIDEDMLFMSIIDDNYWYEFTITELQVE